MLSLLDVLLVILSATPASTSPVRRWLNISSSVATLSSSRSVVLPLSTGVIEESAAIHVAYTTTSDDCEDMSTAVADQASPTWPAALSVIQPSSVGGNGAYDNSQMTSAPVQQYHQASTPAPYSSPTSQAMSDPGRYESAPPYAVPSAGNHSNTTLVRPSGYGAAKPYASSSLSGTTTLTLYTTVGPDASQATSATQEYGNSSTSSGGTNSGTDTYNDQSSSLAAYDTTSSSFAIKTRTRGHGGAQSSPVAYSSQSSAGSSSSAAPSSHSERSTRTRHQTTHAEASDTYATSQSSLSSSSLPPAYPTPGESSSTASTVTVDPVPTTYSAPADAYSYSPQPSTTTTTMPTEPTEPAAPSAYTQPEHSYGGGFPWLPTVVTGSEPSPTDSSTTTTSTSSSSSSSTTSSTYMAGITIVPMDPDAETVYITVTTTEAGMTTTVAGPTVTAYD